jgi:hypothetical protein
MSKYQNASDLSIRMKNDRTRERPDCDEILSTRKQWALNKNEFDIKAEMQKMEKNNVKFIYKIIETKFNEK